VLFSGSTAANGVFEAIVRNQSQNGARLAFGDALAVPPTFNLAIAGEFVARTAKVRWRSMTAMGIEFM
jgi:hypothetical protein